MRRESVRLSRRHQGWVYASFGVLLASGVLWLVAHYWLRSEGEFGETTSPLAPWALEVHGAAAMVALVVLGTLLPGHVRRAWHARRSRRTGALLLALSGILIASGYALYYAGSEQVRAVASVLHWSVGLAVPALLGGHVWAAQRRKARKSRWRGRGLTGRAALRPVRSSRGAGLSTSGGPAVERVDAQLHGAAHRADATRGVRAADA